MAKQPPAKKQATARKDVAREPADADLGPFFATIVENSPAVCYVRDLSRGTTLYVNKAVEALVGFDPGAFGADPDLWDARIHPDDQERILTQNRTLAATKRPINREYRLVHRTGRVVWVEERAAAIRETGQDCMHGVLVDITSLKASQRRTAVADSALARLIDAATRINVERTLAGVLQVVADSARQVIGCHYAALGILSPDGTALEQFVASGIDADLSSRIGDLPTGKGLLGLLIEAPRPIRITNIADHPKARGFPAHHPDMRSFLGVPVVDATGPIGNLYFTEKIGASAFSEEDEKLAVMFAANAAVAVRNARLDEESVRLLMHLQQLQRSRDRFYAMVNHELRNALTAVHGWAELIQRKAGSDPPRAVRETVAAADHAIQLISDLLDLSRLDADMMNVTMKVAEARALAEDAAKQMEPAADDGRVRIEIVGSPGIACVTDEKRVRQILHNLLSNAVRHSPPDSIITIAVAATDATVTFDVIDQGEGIGVDELSIIFDAYVRATSGTGGGTGLGLTLSRRLARMLGGDLTVASQLGHGARFALTIARNLPST
jgi:PAS domain S-box-containing protein